MRIVGRFSDMLQRLLERSRNGDVNWHRLTTAGNETREYFVLLPDAMITVTLEPSPRTPDRIRLRIDRFDEQGQCWPIKEWAFVEGEEDWDFVLDLHNEAERFAMGWDRILSDLERSITQEGQVGEPGASAGVGRAAVARPIAAGTGGPSRSAAG
jgi:hypothetical protein